MKTLHNSDASGAHKNVPDLRKLVVYGGYFDDAEALPGAAVDSD